MIKHAVLLYFNEKINASVITNIDAGFSALAASMPEIKSYEFAEDAGIYKNNADYLLLATFDDEESFKRYVEDKRHLEFMKKNIAPYLKCYYSSQIKL